jgi:23S rRNA pseudouridine2457 synthase
MSKYLYFSVYKPYLCLSQFTREGDLLCLKDFFDFPKDVYPVGRLDADSEGLLLLTNDPAVNHRLLNPKFLHHKTYFAQVEGNISDESLQRLASGIEISVNKKIYKTLPAVAKKISEPNLPERNPPIRFRKNIPAEWLSLQICEGKNRQVRKMTAAVGLPTLRLVRFGIENMTLENLQPAEFKTWERGNFFKTLNL